jgi:hypothetical protein
MMQINAARRWLLLAAAFLLLTVVGCSTETTVSSISANPAQFDGKSVTVRGTVAELRETISRAGNHYSTFQIRDPTGHATKVFIWGHPSIMNGDPAEVTGVFQQVRRVGRYTFYNEIDAQSVRPFTH